MTLIAAFKTEGIPTLIGDFLLTANKDKAGVRKKIAILADNFAIGWTGDLLAAEQIFQSLSESLKNIIPTKCIIEKILTNPSFVDVKPFSENIIGWIIDSEGSHCFRWNSLWPTELFYEENLMTDGSGEAVAKSFLGDGNFGGPEKRQFQSDLEQESWLLFLLLSSNYALMRFIIFESDHFESLFSSGFSFESIYFSKNKKFIYLDNILYIGLICHVDENGKYLRGQIHPKLYKYETIKNVSKITIFDVEKKSQEISYVSIPSGHSEFQDPKTVCVKTKLQAIHNCVCMLILSPNHPPQMVFLTDQSEDKKIVSIQNNSVIISIGPSIVEACHKHHREHGF